jgi:hypothetical protein
VCLDANPFGTPTSDEVPVVDNLQTVLPNLDPAIVQQMFSDLLGTEILRFEDWQTEVVVAADEKPDLDVEEDMGGRIFSPTESLFHFLNTRIEIYGPNPSPDILNSCDSTISGLAILI